MNYFSISADSKKVEIITTFYIIKKIVDNLNLVYAQEFHVPKEHKKKAI